MSPTPTFAALYNVLVDKTEGMILREKLAGYRAVAALRDEEIRNYTFEDRWQQILTVQSMAKYVKKQPRARDEKQDYYWRLLRERLIPDRT